MTKPNKFEVMPREELVRLCLEQEDELEKLRPKPAKFKLGQLLKASANTIRPTFPGQPAFYFIVLSLEHKNGKWWYGYSKKSTVGGFLVPLTKAELEGGALPEIPEQVPMTASTQPQYIPGTGSLGL